MPTVSDLGAVVISAVNDEEVLTSTLAKSPMIADGHVPLIAERGHSSASKAYNAGMDRTNVPLLIFAHQDIYFPAGWQNRLREVVTGLEQRGAKWGVLGVWGVQSSGTFAGRVWCNAGNREYCGPVETPAEVSSLDEVVLVLNSAAGLRFDNNLPGFHLYATDIIQQAKARSYNAFAIDAPVVHNNRTVVHLDSSYWAAYRYMQRKWHAHLPLPTSVLPVTGSCWPLRIRWIRMEVARRRGRIPMRTRDPEPSRAAARLGYNS